MIKDGGDDPDVTTGAYIYASVRILHSDTSASVSYTHLDVYKRQSPDRR